MPQGMSPQQWWFLMQQLAQHGQDEVFAGSTSSGRQGESSGDITPTTSTPAPYERIGKTSSDTPSGGQGPLTYPGNLPPPAADPTRNPPTTAPYDPKFESPTSPTPSPSPFVNVRPSENRYPDWPGQYQPPDTYNPPTVEGMTPAPVDTYQTPNFTNPPINEPVGTPNYPGSYQSPFEYSGPGYGPDWWLTQGSPFISQNPPDLSNPPLTDTGAPPTPTDTYQTPDLSNPPTSETMLPDWPGTYQSPDPTNPAPNEDVMPSPVDTYQPSDSTVFTPTEGQPDPSTTPTGLYPTGDGTYPTADTPVTPTYPFGLDPTGTGFPTSDSTVPNYSPDQVAHLGPLPGPTFGFGATGGNLGNVGSILGNEELMHAMKFGMMPQNAFGARRGSWTPALMNYWSNVFKDRGYVNPQSPKVQEGRIPGGGEQGRTPATSSA